MNNLSLTQMSTFIAVGELKSFRLAADRLNISPPAVSARIQQLEQQLGLKLLNRTTRSVSLTPEGERLMHAASDALVELQRITGQLRDEALLKSGRVTIAVINSLSITIAPGLLAAFKEKHPRIFVVMHDLNSDAIIASVESGVSDIGIASHFESRRDLNFEPLLHDESYVIVPKGHRLASRKSVKIGELADERLLVAPRGTGYRDLIDAACIRANVKLTPERELQSAATTVAMTAGGHGICIVPASFLRIADLTNCVKLAFDPVDTLHRTMGIITLNHRSLSPAARTFRAFVKDWLRSHPSYYRDAENT